MTGCRHRHIVLRSRDDGHTASSAHCGDCKAPLTRRVENGDYVYSTALDITPVLAWRTT